jgi:hypothetical protein
MICPLKSAARHSYKTSWLKFAPTTRALINPTLRNPRRRVKSAQRIDASQKTAETRPPQPLATPPRVFVSYAWGDTSPNALEEDRQRQEVVERLCRTLEKENWQVVRDKNALGTATRFPPS